MRVDMGFQNAAAEAAYLRWRLAAVLPFEHRMDGIRLLITVGIVARLVLLHNSLGTIVNSILLFSAVGVQFSMCGSKKLRERYVAAAVCEVLMVVAASVLVPRLSWGDDAGAPARSLIELIILSGPIWPLFTAIRNPFPFRLFFLVHSTQSAVFMLLTRHMCTSPGIQHGYALLHRRLLRAALHARLLPPEAATAAAAAANIESLCAAVYQPASIVLGNMLVGYLTFCTELSQRRAFVQRRSGASQPQPRLVAVLQQHGRLPVEPSDYWLSFSLPAASMLACLHLSRLALPAFMNAT